MISPTEVIIETTIERLKTGYLHTLGNQNPFHVDLIGWITELALKKIAKTDALYHNINHTSMVTLTGQEILRGKHLLEGNVSSQDWLHCIIAWLCHDIGYVKGICRCDQPSQRLYQTGQEIGPIILPKYATDASLTPYHVDRGKLFIEEHLGNSQLVDLKTIQRYIEHTRFPVPAAPKYKETSTYPGLVRAADLIGQLSDPDYLQKIPALFYEFEETGTNKNLGYKNVADLRHGFPKFYKYVVEQYIQEGLTYLNLTTQGRKIIKDLENNLKTVQQELNDNNEFLEISLNLNNQSCPNKKNP